RGHLPVSRGRPGVRQGVCPDRRRAGLRERGPGPVHVPRRVRELGHEPRVGDGDRRVRGGAGRRLRLLPARHPRRSGSVMPRTATGRRRLLTLVLALILLVLLLPYLWLILTSLKHRNDIFPGNVVRVFAPPLH